MHSVGKINIDIYKCVTEDIVTDDVIITEKQIEHIKERHPDDYERFGKYFKDIVEKPDYTRLYCKAHNRFRDNILSDKEQTARRAVARRGFATQYDEMLAERYVRLAIEGSIYH